MARFAIIDAGRVTNIAEADDAFAASLGWIPALNGGIGDLWDGTTFTTPAPIPIPLTIATVRQQAQDTILAKYPLWVQSNYALGIDPSADINVMKMAIVSVITESNRCEDIIDAGGTATPNWPTI